MTDALRPYHPSPSLSLVVPSRNHLPEDVRHQFPFPPAGAAANICHHRQHINCLEVLLIRNSAIVEKCLQEDQCSANGRPKIVYCSRPIVQSRPCRQGGVFISNCASRDRRNRDYYDDDDDDDDDNPGGRTVTDDRYTFNYGCLCAKNRRPFLVRNKKSSQIYRGSARSSISSWNVRGSQIVAEAKEQWRRGCQSVQCVRQRCAVLIRTQRWRSDDESAASTHKLIHQFFIHIRTISRYICMIW